jgi:hypothetical protein
LAIVEHNIPAAPKIISNVFFIFYTICTCKVIIFNFYSKWNSLKLVNFYQ